MALKSIKDVVILLEAIKDNDQDNLESYIDGEKSPYLRFMSSTLKQTPEEYLNEIKIEIETLTKAIAILEKESDNG